MKTRTVQLTAVAAIAIAATLLASPWVIAATSTASASTASTNSTTSPPYSTGTQGVGPCQQGRGFGPGPGRSDSLRSLGNGPQSTANLTVGQTITVTSSQGEYQVIGTSSKNGTASGTVTFTVTSKLADGYTLSITSGSLVVGGTTYTVSSGSAQTGRATDTISGQGVTSPTGQFLMQGFARGSFAGSTGQLLLDFKAGSSEYAVALTGTVQG